MLRFRATILFEEAPDGEALNRLGRSHEMMLEAEDVPAAWTKASTLAIETFAAKLYPPEDAFCSGCEGTTPEADGNCPDCGGNEWLPPMDPPVIMAWAEGQGWKVAEIHQMEN